MKRRLTSMTPLIFCACLLMLASQPAAVAQTVDAAQSIKESNSPESSACGANKTFTFGVGLDLFKFCLSDHGNILQLQSPVGFRQIIAREGYVACGTGAANAFDAGDAEGGWAAATTTSQPGGANTLPVTIVRQTTDGKFQLTQTFNWDAVQKEITVTMILKNTSGGSLVNVRLARYFDGDLSSSLTTSNATDDIYNRDSDSVLGKDDGAGAGHHGILLTALAFAQPHTTAVESFTNFSSTRSNCAPVAEAVPTAPGDFTGRVTYTLGTLPAGSSKTVKVLYRRF